MQATMISITFRLIPPLIILATSSKIELEPPPRKPLPDLKQIIAEVKAARAFEPEPVTRASRPAVTKKQSRVTKAHKCAWPHCKNPAKPRGRFCGDTCRQRAHRADKTAPSK